MSASNEFFRELFNELALKMAITLPTPEERMRLRKAFGVSQTKLAQALGVSRRSIHAWEHGESDPIDENRERYAELLARWKAREQENQQENQQGNQQENQQGNQ